MRRSKAGPDAKSFEALSGRQRDEERVPRRASREVERETAKVKHDCVNEQVLLAAACVDQPTRRKLLDLVPAESFFAKGHPEAWRAIGELEKRGLTYDPATVRAIAGDAVDTDLLDTYVSLRPEVPPNLMQHVALLSWDRTRIEATKGPVADLLELLRDQNADASVVRAKARAVGDAFGFSGGLLLDTHQVAKEQGRLLDSRTTGQAIYPYGIEGLDLYDKGPKAGHPRMIRGAAPGKLTVVTGLPGSGKSTVVGRMVLGQVALGRSVMWGAWEEGEGDSLEQIAVMSLGYGREAFSSGTFSSEEGRAVKDEMGRLADHVRFMKLVPYERKSGKKRESENDRALDFIHESVVTSGCDVFVADLWRRTVRSFEPEEEEVGLYRQQDIAKTTGSHAILVHQQRSKDVEQRRDTRPTREGLKGSGAWVETPDTILGIHRPALWKLVADDVLEVSVLKQRKGKWPLCVEFDFDPDTAALTNGRGVDVKRDLGSGGSDDLDHFLASEGSRPGNQGRRRGK